MEFGHKLEQSIKLIFKGERKKEISRKERKDKKKGRILWRTSFTVAVEY